MVEVVNLHCSVRNNDISLQTYTYFEVRRHTKPATGAGFMKPLRPSQSTFSD